MMRYGLLFPGQGNFSINSLGELYKKLPEAKYLVNEASDYVSEDFEKIIQSSDLSETKYQQPLICILSAAYFHRLKLNKFASYAGHSLGELSACYAAGVFSFKTLVKLAYERGRLMQAAAKNYQGGMMVIFGVGQEMVKKIIKDSLLGKIFIANINSSQQTVISGLNEDLKAFESVLLARTNAMAKHLKVNGPWHSPYMLQVLDDFKAQFETEIFCEPIGHLYMTYVAHEVHSIAEIKNHLVNQICAPVVWPSLMQYMLENERLDAFIEIGWGQVLKGLNKHIFPKLPFFSLSDLVDARKLVHLGLAHRG